MGRAAINAFLAKAHGFSQIACAAANKESCGSINQDQIARLVVTCSFKDLPDRARARFVVMTSQVFERATLDAEIFRSDFKRSHSSFKCLGYPRRCCQTDLIKPVETVYDPGANRPQLGECMGHQFHCFYFPHPDYLVRCAGRIG